MMCMLSKPIVNKKTASIAAILFSLSAGAFNQNQNLSQNQQLQELKQVELEDKKDDYEFTQQQHNEVGLTIEKTKPKSTRKVKGQYSLQHNHKNFRLSTHTYVVELNEFSNKDSGNRTEKQWPYEKQMPEAAKIEWEDDNGKNQQSKEEQDQYGNVSETRATMKSDEVQKRDIPLRESYEVIHNDEANNNIVIRKVVIENLSEEWDDGEVKNMSEKECYDFINSISQLKLDDKQGNKYYGFCQYK